MNGFMTTAPAIVAWIIILAFLINIKFRFDLKVRNWIAGYFILISELLKAQASKLVIKYINNQQRVILYFIIYYYESFKLRAFNNSMKFIYLIGLFIAIGFYSKNLPFILFICLFLFFPIMVLVFSKDHVKLIILDNVFLSDVKTLHRVNFFGIKSTELMIDFNGVQCLVSDRKKIAKILEISKQEPNKKISVSGYLLTKLMDNKFYFHGRIIEAKIY